MQKFFLFLFTFFLLSKTVFAQDAGFETLQKTVLDLQRSMQQLQQTVAFQNEIIQKQQLQINAIESHAQPEPDSVTVMHANEHHDGEHRKIEIGGVADIVGQVDSPRREDEDGRDRVSVRHLELDFGGALNEDSRFDAAIAFSDFEETHIEEAHYTNRGLPWGLTGRLGRFKPRIGQAIPMHRDALDTVDEPLVIQRYFGSEGFSKTGADLTKPFQFADKIGHSLAFGILEGGSGHDHGDEEENESRLLGASRRHPTLYGNFKNEIKLTQTAEAQVGVSYITGGSDSESHFGTHVVGGDLSWIWNYAEGRHFKIQGETFAGLRTENRGDAVEDNPDTAEFEPTVFPEVDDSRNLWGSYILADWRFHPRWAAGTRFDHVRLVRNTALQHADGSDLGYAAYLTFYQNELARWRVQLNQRNLTSDATEYEALLQGTFTIGDHFHEMA